MTQPEKSAASRQIRASLAVVFLATLIVAAELAMYFIRWILVAILIGVGLGVLFSPLMRFLKKRLRIPRGLSALLFFAISLAIIGGISILIGALVADQLVPLLDKVPQLLSAARSRTAEMLSRYPTILSKLQAIELGGTVGALSHRLAQGLKVGAAAIGGFVFVLVLALYVAIDPEYYLCAFLSVLPPSKRPEAKRLLHEAALALRKWFSSQLIAMIAVGTATAVGLLVIGIDDWLLFGALTAVLDVVPYVGPLIAAATAVVVTFAADPGKTPWVIAVYILMQQFEAHLVIPLVMKERIELPPAHLMVMMLILGRWFGILGILVAPGLLAVLRTVYGSSRSSGPSDAKAA